VAVVVGQVEHQHQTITQLVEMVDQELSFSSIRQLVQLLLAQV
jgi:hypothetical protein